MSNDFNKEYCEALCECTPGQVMEYCISTDPEIEVKEISITDIKLICRENGKSVLVKDLGRLSMDHYSDEYVTNLYNNILWSTWCIVTIGDTSYLLTAYSEDDSDKGLIERYMNIISDSYLIYCRYHKLDSVAKSRDRAWEICKKYNPRLCQDIIDVARTMDISYSEALYHFLISSMPYPMIGINRI